MKYLIDFCGVVGAVESQASMEKACATNADMLIAKKERSSFFHINV